MATFGVLGGGSDAGHFTFTIINRHPDVGIDYHLSDASEGASNLSGHVDPGQTATPRGFQVGSDETLELGSVPVVTIPGGVGAPMIRFWSGAIPGIPSKAQYVNLLAANGYTVTQDSEDISEVTGNGFRVTFDGNGKDDPTTDDFTIQVYKA